MMQGEQGKVRLARGRAKVSRAGGICLFALHSREAIASTPNVLDLVIAKTSSERALQHSRAGGRARVRRAGGTVRVSRAGVCRTEPVGLL